MLLEQPLEMIIIKNYRIISEIGAAYVKTKFAEEESKHDFEGIAKIAHDLVDKYLGTFARTHSVLEATLDDNYGRITRHIQDILHAEIYCGPTIHASIERFECDPTLSHLRAKITEKPGQAGHCDRNTVPLAYPQIARLIGVATTIDLPENSGYHPRKEGGLIRLLDENGLVL